MSFVVLISGRRWQVQLCQAGMSNYIQQFTSGCNYLSLPELTASGAKGLISSVGVKVTFHAGLFSGQDEKNQQKTNDLHACHPSMMRGPNCK